MIKVFSLLVVFTLFKFEMSAQGAVYIKVDEKSKIYNFVKSEDSNKLYDYISYRDTYIISKKVNVSNLEDEIKSIANSKEFNLTFIHNKFKVYNPRQLKIDFISKVNNLVDFEVEDKTKLDKSIEMIFNYYYLEAKRLDNLTLKENSFYYKNLSLKVFNEFHKNFRSHKISEIKDRREKRRLKLVNLNKYLKCKTTRKLDKLRDQLKRADKIFLVIEDENKDYQLIEVSLLLKEKFL